MLLSELLPNRLLNQMINEGYVTVREHPEDSRLKILNYTDKAQIEGVWNVVTSTCRGLIVFGEENVEKVVEERPFKKFFNHTQHDMTVWHPSAEVEVYDKADGSLGILYTAPDGRYAIATRGSFASEQALHATEVFRRKYAGQWYPKSDEYTYLFEIVYPENRIVLNYGGLDDLILLGAVKKSTGKFVPPHAVKVLDGWPGTMVEKIPVRTLGEALALPPRGNREGLVVRLVNSGMTFKVKQEDYIALHKIVFGLNERGIWERIGAGDCLEDILDGLPDEFHDWVTEVFDRICFEMTLKHSQTVIDHHEILDIFRLHKLDWTRKDYALLAQKKATRPYLFLRLDGKEKALIQAIWKSVKPASSTPFKNQQSEEVA